jgi:hypothetical protein
MCAHGHPLDHGKEKELQILALLKRRGGLETFEALAIWHLWMNPNYEISMIVQENVAQSLLHIASTVAWLSFQILGALMFFLLLRSINLKPVNLFD